MKRFRIAFSFAGEKRDFVAEVAAILAKKFGEDKILYDKYHEAEFARARLGRYAARGRKRRLLDCPAVEGNVNFGYLVPNGNLA